MIFNMRILGIFTFQLLAFFLNAQSEIRFNSGILVSGSTSNFEELGGGGLILGCEYSHSKIDFLSIELRTETPFFTYKDKDWMFKNNDYLSYIFYDPNVSIVPKLSLKLSDELDVFVENEFSLEYISGDIQYGDLKKRVSVSNIFSYTPGIGLKYRKGEIGWIGTIGYSTLDLSKIVNKNKPIFYNYLIPNEMKLDIVLSIAINFYSKKL